jgi:FlaA1/EpsC-like NDP-sugar epimerase
MGEPVKIADMARDLIRLSGFEPERDIEIVYTGIRPGEKLYEELFSQREEMTATRHERIFISKGEASDAHKAIKKDIRTIVQNAIKKNTVLNLITSLVPEYQGRNGVDTEQEVS